MRKKVALGDRLRPVLTAALEDGGASAEASLRRASALEGGHPHLFGRDDQRRLLLRGEGNRCIAMSDGGLDVEREELFELEPVLDGHVRGGGAALPVLTAALADCDRQPLELLEFPAMRRAHLLEEGCTVAGHTDPEESGAASRRRAAPP